MSVDADPLPGAAINFHLLRALDKDSSLPVFANTCADEMALVDWTDEQKHISLQMHILKLNPTSNLSRWPGFLFQSEDALCFELSSPGVKASMAGQTPGYL